MNKNITGKGAAMGTTMHSHKEHAATANAPFYSAFFESLHKEQWKEVRLGEVAEIVGGGTPKTSVPEYWGGNIAWLSVADFNNGRKYVSQTQKTITELGLKNSSTKILNQGDIIISARGTVGVVAMLKNPMAFNQTSYGIKSKGLANNHFIYYILKNASNSLVQNSYGSVFNTITSPILNNYKFPLPPLEVQQQIAEILSSFDDKIDLLHRQNKTLESLALTLFRHTFIDNPNRNEWEMGKLGDYVRIVYGKNLPTKNLLPQGYSVFGGNGKIGYFDKYLYEEPQVLVSCRGEASGKVNVSERKSFVTNNSLVLERTKDKDITFYYLKYYCLSSNFYIYVSGSAQPQITIEGLCQASFLKPDFNTINEFSKVVSSFEYKTENNQKQIEALQSMRDMLLAKILNDKMEG